METLCHEHCHHFRQQRPVGSELSDGNATAMRPSVATAMRPSVATVAGIGLVSLQAAGAAFQGAATLPARVGVESRAGLPLSHKMNDHAAARTAQEAAIKEAKKLAAEKAQKGGGAPPRLGTARVQYHGRFGFGRRAWQHGRALARGRSQALDVGRGQHSMRVHALHAHNKCARTRTPRIRTHQIGAWLHGFAEWRAGFADREDVCALILFFTRQRTRFRADAR